jgi:serine phosphatase RsbU (regulator of sigma subunit)
MNFKELLVAILVFGWFLIHKNFAKLQSFSLKQKLWRLTFFLSASYIILFILRLFIQPEYTTAFPNHYLSLSAVIEANISALLAMVVLIPAIMILHDLIFSKPKRTTKLYFNLFIIFLIITSISVLLTRKPIFRFSSETLINDITASLAVFMCLLLSFRNDWITYLPRKDKILYFTVGLVVLAEIIWLPEIVFKPQISTYSLLLAASTNIINIFLLLYGGFVIMKLFFHLPTAKAFDRKLREVNSLYNLARTLNSEQNLPRLTQLITQLTSQVLESNSTWFQLYDPLEKNFHISSHINLTQSQIVNNPLIGLSDLNLLLNENKKALLINDLNQHNKFKDLTKWKKDARSLIAAPLFSNRQQLMGIIYASKVQSYGFDIEDVSLIEGFANQAAIALENADLFQASIKKERLEQEFKIARDVQLKLLPQVVPEHDDFKLETYFIMANEVGGDYFDFFKFRDNYQGIVIGDVSGKGTSAAFYMAEFRGVIQTLAKTFTNPKDLICQANQIFYSNIERKIFVSAIVGKYIPEKKIFQFVRAGHNPIIFTSNHNSKSQFIQPAGLAIGLDKGEIFNKIIKLESVKLSAGDKLFLYTDGLTEARNEDGEEYGEERLCKILESSKKSSSRELKEYLLEDIMHFVGDTPLHDDMTFIVIKTE